MTAYPAWTPAPRPGIVPLHPLGFGTILGRSFTALRQNPRVLLGFALCVQALAYIVLIVATGGVALASFSRLETVPVGTDEFDAIFAGSIAVTAITAFVLGLASGALSVIIQGVVVSEVAAAVVAEKLSLGTIWRRVRPVAWRLIGYSFLLALVTLVAIALVGGLLFLIGMAALPLAIALGIIAALGAIPLTAWISTKLFLAPAAIIIEHASITTAIGRSWRLTRDRFWSTFGVIIIISMTFGVIAQVVTIPTSLFSTGITTIFSPTGDPEPGAIVAFIVSTLITQMLTLLVQCIALIVQSTAAALIYVDCRMRHEGLDLDLQTYVDRRGAGATDLPDPYRQNVGRTIDPRQHAYPVPGSPVAAYPGQGYPAPYPAPPLPAPPAGTSAQPQQPQEPAPAAPAAAPPTRWTAPGDGS